VTGPRGKRQAIVGEELVRPAGAAEADLYEKLACGHFLLGVYNRDGDSCSAGGMPVKSRICRQCLNGDPVGPPGEIVGP
jgi:hypothetical protein